MALISCPHCNHQCSTNDLYCPTCGQALKNPSALGTPQGDFQQVQPPTKTNKTLWIILGLLVGIPTILLGGCAACVALLGLSAANNPEQPKRVEERPRYTFDELRQSLFFATKEEVLKKLGTPDSVSDSGDTVYWYYHGKIAYDPVSGQVSSLTQIVFDHDGHVKGINFN